MAETDKDNMNEKKTGSETSATGGKGKDAIELLKQDHRKVEGLFAELEKARTRGQKNRIIEQITTELKVHAELEERLFYPAVRPETDDDSKLDEAQVEHDTLKILIADLENSGPEQPFFDAKVTVLKEYVEHHVKEEEASDGVMAQAKKAGIDLAALGGEIEQLKMELQRDPGQIEARPVSIRQQEKERAMPRQYDDNRGNNRERDDQGRFMSSRDGGNGGGRSRGSSRYEDEERYGSGRGRYDDRDDYRSSRSSGGGGRGYDDYDDRDAGYSRRGRGDDEGRDHGQGGWFGDSRGHSEAARRGWENRGGSSRSSRYDDEDDYRSRSSSSSGGRGGRDYDDDDRDHGRGGWFGDSRGHSEAARRGWENRR